MENENIKGDSMETKEPFISVVICAFSSKRFDMTIDCIYSIFNNSYKNYEIILVIDGNSELKQKMDIKFKDVSNITIIENKENQGPAISRNRGVECAKGEIVAFIDDDAFATSDWLSHIAEDFYHHPDIFVVGGKLLLVYEKVSKKLPEELLWIVGGTYKGHPENKQVVRNVFAGNMAVRKRIFQEIKFEMMFGNNNKNLSHNLEDTLFCVRLNNKMPNTILYDPEIVAYHHVPNERLKNGYIFKRALSEGILKAKLKNIYNGNHTLSYENSYLNLVMNSILKNFVTLNMRDATLLSMTVIGVSIGYAGYLLKKD